MTTATLIDAEQLKASLSLAFSLRVQPLRKLTEAIARHEVNFSTEVLDFVALGIKEPSIRKAVLLDWLNGTGLHFEWIDAIVAALKPEVAKLVWDDDRGVLYVECM